MLASARGVRRDATFMNCRNVTRGSQATFLTIPPGLLYQARPGWQRTLLFPAPHSPHERSGAFAELVYR